MGKTALVTGAGRRLGQAIAISLGQAGADVVLHVHTTSAQETRRALEACGRRTWTVSANLSQPRQVQQCAESALAEAGNIDILVNNAALFYPTQIGTLTGTDWRTLMTTNMSAPFLLSLLIGRHMYQRGGGSIVMLGDWSGQRPSRDFLPYCVAKAGVHQLTRALAKAFAPYVRVNEVAPGPVLLPEEYEPEQRAQLRRRTPLGRIGTPDDIVRAVHFLVAEGEYVSGASYVVDGGWLAAGDAGSETSL